MSERHDQPIYQERTTIRQSRKNELPIYQEKPSDEGPWGGGDHQSIDQGENSQPIHLGNLRGDKLKWMDREEET